jgi:hypothetical protein
MSLNSQEYYNGTVLNFLKAEHLDRNTGLVRILRSGERRVYKKDIKALQPFSKEFLAEITHSNPRLLDLYKNLKGARGALENKDLEGDYSETELANALAEKLIKIPAGKKHANDYHTTIAGILTFLFYPELVSPVLEERLHEGRKRIDLTFTNWSRDGFFSTIRMSPQTKARFVIVECKNYAEDLGNPEFDQLTGRFSPSRGRFGIICCRTNGDRKAIVARSKDAMNDDRGTVLVFNDDEIVAMLKTVAAGNRKDIFRTLEKKYREIAF